MTATFVDAIRAWERAAASFLRRATSCAGGVGPQAVRWKDLWASHDGIERRSDKNPGSNRQSNPRKWQMGKSQLQWGRRVVLGPIPLQECVSTLNSTMFQSEARSLSPGHCRRLIALRWTYRIIVLGDCYLAIIIFGRCLHFMTPSFNAVLSMWHVILIFRMVISTDAYIGDLLPKMSC